MTKTAHFVAESSDRLVLKYFFVCRLDLSRAYRKQHEPVEFLHFRLEHMRNLLVDFDSIRLVVGLGLNMVGV